MNRKEELTVRSRHLHERFVTDKLIEESIYVAHLYRIQMILASHYSIFISCIPSIETGEDKWTTNIGAGRENSLFDTYVEALEDGLVRGLRRIQMEHSSSLKDIL
jgi:hypothetical protein